MLESLKETERLTSDTELLRAQCAELQEENEHFYAQFMANGLVPPVLEQKTEQDVAL